VVSDIVERLRYKAKKAGFDFGIWIDAANEIEQLRDHINVVEDENTTIGDGAVQLNEENEQLRAEIEQLRAEIEQLRAANAGEGFPHYGVCGEEAAQLRTEVGQLRNEVCILQGANGAKAQSLELVRAEVEQLRQDERLV